jgi:hypothetical protein
VVKFLVMLACAAALRGAAGEEKAAAYAQQVARVTLDVQSCHRVRDLAFQREDLKIYLNEGYLMFSDEVGGRRLAAVFVADGPTGDAEIIVMPPYRSERASLARFTKSPNLSEHFTAAVFLFTDNTAQELLAAIAGGVPQPAPEVGATLASAYTNTVRNLASSFIVRLVMDQLATRPDSGFFYAAVSGRRLGNFDFIYDPVQPDSVTLGQLVTRDGLQFFDMWASFPARSFRNNRRQRLAQQVELQRVEIDTALAPDLAVTVSTRLHLRAGEDPVQVLPFDLTRRMTVAEVLVDNVPVEVFSRESLRASLVRGTENETYLAVLPEALQPGSEHVLEVKHSGRVVEEAGNGVYFVSARTNWYPGIGFAFAPYDLTFRYPKELQLVATGSLVEERLDGDLRVMRRTTSSPVRFAGFNLGNYQKSAATSAGVAIDVYANRRVETALQPRGAEIVVLPQPTVRGNARRPLTTTTLPPPPAPNPTHRLEDLAKDVAEAVEFMSTHFGPPPLKTLTVAPIPGAFGQGFSGLVYLSTLAYLDPASRPASVRTQYQQVFFSELLHAHESAHQWWGNLVTSGGYRDDWLMEALANYSALLLLEKKKGPKALSAVLDEYRSHLLLRFPGAGTVESAGPVVWGTRINSSQTPGAARTIMYEKGSWILHMLRARLGDASFLKLLGETASRYRFKPLSTAEFQTLAASYMPPGADDRNLEMFFDQWVYATGVPALRLEYKVAGKAPRLRVEVRVTQSDVPEDFTTSVPVEIQLPNKRSIVKWVRTSNEEATLSVEVPAVPTRVTLDPSNSILALRARS